MAQIIEQETYATDAARRLADVIHLLTKPDVNFSGATRSSRTIPEPEHRDDGTYQTTQHGLISLEIGGSACYGDSFVNVSPDAIEATVWICRFIRNIIDGTFTVNSFSVDRLNDDNTFPTPFELRLECEVKEGAIIRW